MKTLFQYHYNELDARLSVKLGSIHEGTVFCTSGLDVCTYDPTGEIERVGRFPAPTGAIDRSKFAVTNRSASKDVLERITGRYQSTNIWGLRGDDVLASVGRWVFKSSDGGRTWKRVLPLAKSSPPKGILPSSVCLHEGNVYLAEYSLDDEPARIYVSRDFGDTWSEFVERDDFRHFHGVYHDPYTGELWANTGDADSESAIGVVTDGEFRPVGRGSQRWRGVELAFTEDSILWGRDAAYLEEKPIYRLRRDRLGDDDPEPEVVGATDSMLFYFETAAFDGREWVFASLSSQTGIDSTAPPDERRNTCSRTTEVLATPANSGYETWYTLFSSERRTAVGEFTRFVPTADSHVFIAAESEIGVLLNPYNTKSRDGSILRVPPETFGGGELDVAPTGRSNTSRYRDVTVQ